MLFFLFDSATLPTMQKPKVLVIAGSTATGKTDLAINLAQQFDGEVISADSRQIYRKLDIGTAKVTKEEMQGVPHHLIDIVDVRDSYTADQFAHDAQTAIADITARGKLPIIAGGSFFYVDVALGRISSPQVAPNPVLRAELELLPTATLYERLREADPSRAATMDPYNKRRLVRALEIVEALGSVPSTNVDELYDALWLGITRERDDIRARIAKRAEQWLIDGFKEEVQWLLSQNLSPEQLNEFGFEYTIGVAWARNEITDQEFIEQICAKNWQYAKRQRTWLKQNESIQWIEAGDITTANKLVTNWLED